MLSQDHFRQVVKPCFTEVYRDRGEAIGVAEFETMEDMRTAIRRLDDTEFKNPFEKSYIRIIEVSVVLQDRATSWWAISAAEMSPHIDSQSLPLGHHVGQSAAVMTKPGCGRGSRPRHVSTAPAQNAGTYCLQHVILTDH